MVDLKTVELLAPSKDYSSAVAAVDYGADALYIGGARFGARHAAGNSTEEIARVVEYAHKYGVRVHATVNTLLWDSELEAAEAQARELIAAGVDALIVQDMALRRMNLPVELHASTQVCNMTPEGAKFLGDTGFARVILERSLSLDEIRRICQSTSAEVECFVHGAICVGYSGRCFLSRSMSESRSGNRGACSQPCRLTWDLTDGNGTKYITGKHLLSVQDMNLSHRIGDLLDAGVSSFKIEGRLKDVGYIKNVVAYYRKEIDRALASRPWLERASVGESRYDFTPDTAKSFTRGESEYFFDGKHRGVASFDTPKSVGERIGRVTRIEGRAFRMQGAERLHPGDGICFVSNGELVGTNVNLVEGDRITPNRIDGIVKGTDIFRNYDHKFSKALSVSRTRRVIPADARLEITSSRLRLTFTDCTGITATLEKEATFEAAKNAEANLRSLVQQVQKSGDTIFAVGNVEVEGGDYFVPASQMAACRREGLELLLAERMKHTPPHHITDEVTSTRYPSSILLNEDNVTNHLAREFYRDHGVEQIAPALELQDDFTGERVMRSSYCIRRELGECLKKNPRLKGDLYLERGMMRYKLEFDCKHCEMSLRACAKREY